MTTTLNQAYGERLDRLADIEPARHANVLGGVPDGNGLGIRYYNHIYHIFPGRIEDTQGCPPTDAVGLVLCQYVLRSPKNMPGDGRLVTFRELEGAGPLVASFTGNTNKLIADTFASRLEDLRSAALQIGGRQKNDEHNYDLVIKFNALPRVPIFLKFNAADELFPARSTLLFHQSAQIYLDMQSLFILGTYLAGQLIRSGRV